MWYLNSPPIITTVVINMTIEQPSPTEATILISCNRPYTNLESIFLNATISHHNSPTNTKIIDHMISIPCSGSWNFTTLYDTEYYVTVSWEKVVPCTLDIFKILRTGKEKPCKSLSLAITLHSHNELSNYRFIVHVIFSCIATASIIIYAAIAALAFIVIVSSIVHLMCITVFCTRK